jgi:adenosylhomocysteine nucleosidase
MKPGDLFTPERVRRLKDEESAVADPSLREGAVQQGAMPTKTLITMTRLVSTREEKSRLAFFGEAIDMESAAVMAHFIKRAVPSVTVRAISDAADEDLPVDFDRCLTPQGAIKPLSLVNEIVRRPGNLSNLVRFGRQSNQAAQKLIAFLDQFVVSLPAIREKAVMA